MPPPPGTCSPGCCPCTSGSSARSTRPPSPPGTSSPTGPRGRSMAPAHREVAPACSLAPGSQVSPADQRRTPGGARASRLWFIYCQRHRALEHNSGLTISTECPLRAPDCLHGYACPPGTKNVRICRISGVRSSPMQSSPRLGAASTSTSDSGQHRPQGSQPCRTLLRLTQRLITGTSH
jgi:hypothetical protein